MAGQIQECRLMAKTNSDPRCSRPDDCQSKGGALCRACNLSSLRADPEVRARHAAAMADPEVRARHAAAMKAAMADPEVRARHAAAMADPEVRARKSAAMKAAMADPEVRARHAAAMADPEVRARHAAAMADPEVRARHAAAMKAAMADPEVRARHAAAMADPEVRARITQARLSWCPPEFLDLYRVLVKKVGAKDARVMVEEEVAVISRRTAAPEAPRRGYLDFSVPVNP
jgi:hypothetical protein